MKVPGAVYSLLLAVGAWAVDYFTEGAGSGLPWAAIALAVIPFILKMFTVNAPPEPTPEGAMGAPRGADEAQSSKMRQFLLG